LLEAWGEAGLDPFLFWRSTPGLVALHLRAEAKRNGQQMRAQAWMTAMLTRADKMPEFDEFVTGKRNRAREVERWVAAWADVAPALNANRKPE